MEDGASRFSVPTEIVHGEGCSQQLGQEAKGLGAGKVFFVTDAGVKAAGILEPALRSLEDSGIPCVMYDQAPADPEIPDIDRAARLLREEGCDFVVCAGGGSALGVGKAVAVAATHEGSVRDYLGEEKYTHTPLPCIAIPTTAGSGSEVSKHATLTDDRTGKKVGVVGYRVAPRLALLDPLLLCSVPRMQAVASGIDAFCHAMEAYVSAWASPLTDAIALGSLRTICWDLVPSILEDDDGARSRMLLASSMANMVSGNAGLGLVHGLNGGLTRLFKARGYPPVPYGLLHAVLLPHVLKFNLPVAHAKLADIAVAMGAGAVGEGESSLAEEAVDRITEMLIVLGAPRRLPWVAVPPEHIQEAVVETMSRPHWRSNPRRATEAELSSLVEQALAGW